MTDPSLRARAGRWAHAPPAVVVGAVLAGAGLTGCAPAGSTAGDLPPPPATLEVRLADLGFHHPPLVPAGRVVVVAVNADAVDHSLVLVALPDDLPPILDQLRGDTRRPVATLANMPRQPPGSRGTLAVDLEPGRYAFVCFLRDADGVTHALRGMASEFRVPA